MSVTLPAAVNAIVEIRNDHRGRGLYAVRNIKAGELIISELAHSWSVKSQHLAEFCSSCMKRLSRDTSCARCHVVRYCSSDCQRDHWPIHKLECAAMKATPANMSAHEVMGEVFETARMILMHRAIKAHKGDKPLPPILAKAAESMPLVEQMATVESFQAGKVSVGVNSQLETLFVQLTRGYLQSASKDKSCVESDSDILMWRKRWICNAQSLNTDEWAFAPAGGMFLIIALINHSCAYNAVWSNARTTINVIARKAIPKGEEISISYVSTDEPTSVRRTALKKFGFDCGCAMCTESDRGVDGLSDRDRAISGVRCGGSCPGFFGWPPGSSADIACSRCSRVANAGDLQHQIDDLADQIARYRASGMSSDNAAEERRLAKRVDELLSLGHALNVKLATAIASRPGANAKSRTTATDRVVNHARFCNEEITLISLTWAYLTAKMEHERSIDLAGIAKLRKQAKQVIGETHPFYQMMGQVESEYTRMQRGGR